MSKMTGEIAHILKSTHLIIKCKYFHKNVSKPFGNFKFNKTSILINVFFFFYNEALLLNKQQFSLFSNKLLSEHRSYCMCKFSSICHHDCNNSFLQLKKETKGVIMIKKRTLNFPCQLVTQKKLGLFDNIHINHIF